MHKNILYVNTHFAPDYFYGGVVESSSKIHKYVNRLIPFYAVAVSSNPDDVNKYLNQSGICFKSVISHHFGISFDLIIPLWKMIGKSDLIVVNGIFTFPVTLAQIFCIVRCKKFIVSVRGGLEPWRLNRKKFRKVLFNKFVTFPLLQHASWIHVTSAEEERHVAILGFKNTKLISNGVDVELFESFAPQNKKYFHNEKFIFLFLSRTDKEKGLDILLSAYKKFLFVNKEESNVDFVLAIVGPDNQGYLANLNIDFEKSNIIRINGVYGSDKMQIIYESDCIILPSYSENFGNIIAEAMAMSKPVITTTGTPWRVLKERNLGFYVEPTEDEIFKAMQTIYTMPKPDRDQLGRCANHFIINNMSWASKALQFVALFKGVN